MKIFIIISLIFLSISCTSKQEIELTISNPLDIQVSKAIVEIPLKDLSKLVLKDSTKTYGVKDENGIRIPSQVTYDNKLIFQVNLGSKESKNYNISIDSIVYFEPKVYGRFYPERKGDFSWENDCVGFRLYGDSLRYSDGPSNALDLWLKRTDKLILDKWYYDELVNKKTYHQDHGEGCDPYTVGRTLGAGNIAPFVNDSLYLNSNFLSYEILDEGPLRFTFKLVYPTMKIGDKEVSESKIISLDAGSQVNKIEQKFGFEKTTPVAVGIIKRDSGDSIIVSKEYSTLVYGEPSMGDNGQLFIGVIIPEGITRDTIYTLNYTNPVNGKKSTFTNVLAISEYNPERSFTYYTGFGWSKFGFQNADEFNQYIQHYSQVLQEPLVVKIK